MSVDIAVLTIIYGVCLGPIVGLLSWFVVRLARNPQAGQVFEGVATGAILAVFASLLLTHSGGVRGGVLVWLAFVIACGMAMWLPTPFRASDLFVASAVPSLVLLGATLALYAIPQFLHDFGCAVVSMSAEDRERACPPTPDVMGLTLFVALISIPGITVGLYARARLITFIKLAVGVDPTKLSRIERFTNGAVRIGTAIGGEVARWWRFDSSYGSPPREEEVHQTFASKKRSQINLPLAMHISRLMHTAYGQGAFSAFGRVSL